MTHSACSISRTGERYKPMFLCALGMDTLLATEYSEAPDETSSPFKALPTPTYSHEHKHSTAHPNWTVVRGLDSCCTELSPQDTQMTYFCLTCAEVKDPKSFKNPKRHSFWLIRTTPSLSQCLSLLMARSFCSCFPLTHRDLGRIAERVKKSDERRECYFLLNLLGNFGQR